MKRNHVVCLLLRCADATLYCGDDGHGRRRLANAEGVARNVLTQARRPVDFSVLRGAIGRALSRAVWSGR